MPETLREFHDRVDGFTADSLPHDGPLVTRDSLQAKVAPDGTLRPFFGNTLIYRLTDESKLALARRQTLLHHRCGYALAEPLQPDTFHITLHDLVNGPDEGSIERDLVYAELRTRCLLDILANDMPPVIRLRSTHVFSMVNTSVVMGFEPVTEQDCDILMKLYEYFHSVVPLNWGLTPHVTLAYYKPGVYGPETVDALRQVIREAEELPPVEVALSFADLCYATFSDMNHYE